MRKVFIDVIVLHTADGGKVPLSLTWEDGRRFPVDRVTDVCRAASMKVGGVGTRYTCCIGGKYIFLWLEEGRWFVEAH